MPIVADPVNITESVPLRHALSFDIEDWFHIVDIASTSDPSGWERLPSIVERETHRILDLLAETSVHATFFFLGWIAERYPALVDRVVREGHEIGTHSFWHQRVYELAPDTFYEDLVDSIEVVQQQAGVNVRGFRAPSFSITPGCEWAFEMIAKAGLAYDASLFPARRAHGGYPCPPAPHCRLTKENGALAELPMSTMSIGPKTLCYSGGGYFRLLPLRLIEHGIQQNANLGRPTVIYLHPRDFAEDCPVLPMPWHRRFKSYYGRASTEPKLRKLLSRYSFGSCWEVLQDQGLLPSKAPVAAHTPSIDA